MYIHDPSLKYPVYLISGCDQQSTMRFLYIAMVIAVVSLVNVDVTVEDTHLGQYPPGYLTAYRQVSRTWYGQIIKYM